MSDSKNDINIIPAPKLKPNLKALLTKSDANIADAFDVIKEAMMGDYKITEKLSAAKSWVIFNIQLRDEIQKEDLRKLQMQSIALNNKKRVLDLEVDNDSSGGYKRSDSNDQPVGLDVTGDYGFIDGNKPLRN